jgi:hypothetical protein
MYDYCTKQLQQIVTTSFSSYNLLIGCLQRIWNKFSIINIINYNTLPPGYNIGRIMTVSSPSSSSIAATDQHHDAPHRGRAHNLNPASFSFALGHAQFWYHDALIDDAIIPDCVPCHEDSTTEMVMMMLFDSFTPKMIPSI